MNFTLTQGSKRVLEDIKKTMIKRYEDKDTTRFKIKFTKKKEFLAVPVLSFKGPAFQLFINNKFHKIYLFEKKVWREI